MSYIKANVPQIMKPKLFQRFEGIKTLVTPTANKINSAISPNTKRLNQLEIQNLQENQPASQYRQ